MDEFLNVKLQQVINYSLIFSKDPRTKVGCLLMDENYNNIKFGTNTFPNGIKNLSNRWERINKHNYVIHAEINCIFESFKQINNLNNCILLTTKFPCHECIKIIIQTGIYIIYTLPPDYTDDKWKNSYKIANELIKESNIKIILLKK